MPPPTLDHGVRARERVVCQHGLDGAQQQLSVVFASKQHAEGLGEALNPLDDVLAIPFTQKETRQTE